MAALVTLTKMIASVRLRANLENQTAFIPDSEVREYLNYGITELYDLLVKARAQEYFRKSATFTTTVAVPFYSYSTMGCTDFYEGISVNIGSGNDAVSARPYMECERNMLNGYPGGWDYIRPIVFYRYIGGATSSSGGLNFTPAPSGATSITVNYYPVFTPFDTSGSGDSNSFDGINGWEEYAIYRAVAQCKAKGDEDPAFPLAMLAGLRQRIEALASQRDSGAAERVHDVVAETGFWGSEWGI